MESASLMGQSGPWSAMAVFVLAENGSALPKIAQRDSEAWRSMMGNGMTMTRIQRMILMFKI